MKVLQPSLSGGELSPGLQGRVDTTRYAISLKTCRNMITKPTGGAVKRSGRIFRGYVKHADKVTRFIPFIYSTEVKYLIEMGDGYLRFWVGGALLTEASKPITGITQANPAVVTVTGHGFSNGDHVLIEGVQGMDRLNNRSYEISNVTANTFRLVGVNTSAYAAYTSAGTAARVVEVATPYDEAKVNDVRYTQSADVVTLVHGNVLTKQLRRTAATSFELVDFAFKRGPFRPINTDKALLMAASDVTGVVTVTVNVDTFTASMVGSLLYMEESELRGVKPWASAEKNVALGALRRSDSKIYRVSSIPVVVSPAYYVTGATRPVHTEGRAFDGPQDVKNDGANNYTVGVEWEFLHNTFGIVQITGYTDARTVTAVVLERLPDSIKGTAPSPGNTWTFSGNGSTTVFSITGASSPSYLDYQVTIGGVPIPANSYNPGGGGPGYCVATTSFLPDGARAGSVRRGDAMQLADPVTLEPSEGIVSHSQQQIELCYRIFTASGVSLVCSSSAPIPVRAGGYRTPDQLMGHEVPVLMDGQARWDVIADIQSVGAQAVQSITVGDRCFWAGESFGRYILHHNAKPIDAL